MHHHEQSLLRDEGTFLGINPKQETLMNIIYIIKLQSFRAFMKKKNHVMFFIYFWRNTVRRRILKRAENCSKRIALDLKQYSTNSFKKYICNDLFIHLGPYRCTLSIQKLKNPKLQEAWL